MQVRFVGGPLDGEVREIDDERARNGATIYWPPDRHDVEEPRVPGDVGVVEYLSRGDGTAEYVSGVLAAGEGGRGDVPGANAAPAEDGP